MGNRGDLHAPDGTLWLKYRLRRWICCTTEEIEGKVTFDTPGLYYPVFFCDEAVALAAGHRPCGWCRAADFERFRACWRAAHRLPFNAFLPARQIDQHLHSARIDRRGRQITFGARLGDLPDGVFLTLPEAPEQPMLLWKGALHPWSHACYEPPVEALSDNVVTVLTPAPIVAVIRAGYQPFVRFSAASRSASRHSATENKPQQLRLPLDELCNGGGKLTRAPVIFGRSRIDDDGRVIESENFYRFVADAPISELHRQFPHEFARHVDMLADQRARPFEFQPHLRCFRAFIRHMGRAPSHDHVPLTDRLGVMRWRTRTAQTQRAEAEARHYERLVHAAALRTVRECAEAEARRRGREIELPAVPALMPASSSNILSSPPRALQLDASDELHD
jgi:hypothetical protein